MNEKAEEYLYRYKEREDAYYDPEYERIYRLGTKVELFKYRVLSYTPCGAWIHYYGNSSNKKFINFNWKKKFACKTPEDALDCFIARKNRHSAILTRQLKIVNDSLAIAKNMKEKGIFNEQNCIGFKFSN